MPSPECEDSECTEAGMLRELDTEDDLEKLFTRARSGSEDLKELEILSNLRGLERRDFHVAS